MLFHNTDFLTMIQIVSVTINFRYSECYFRHVFLTEIAYSLRKCTRTHRIVYPCVVKTVNKFVPYSTEGLFLSIPLFGYTNIVTLVVINSVHFVTHFCKYYCGENKATTFSLLIAWYNIPILLKHVKMVFLRFKQFLQNTDVIK